MSQPYDPQYPGQPTPPPPAGYPQQPTAPQYGAPAPAPAPQYGAPAPQYGAPAPQYGAPAPQYGAPAPQYGAPAPMYGAPAPAPARKAPGLAVAGLVLAFLAPPVGLILSLVALPKTKRAGAGRGLAITGAVLGGLFTLVAIGAGVLIAKGIGAVAKPAAAVVAFNHAIDNNDCQEFLDSTSQAFQADAGVTDCTAFEQYAAATVDGTADYTVKITGIASENGTTTVTTSETYTLTSDNSEATDTYTYTMVQEGGAWKVDTVEYTG